MNTYQIHNKQIMEGVTDFRNWQHLPTGILRCVACGQHNITAPIMNYFNWDGSRFTCRKCQDENKEPFDEKAFILDKHYLATNIN